MVGGRSRQGIKIGVKRGCNRYPSNHCVSGLYNNTGICSPDNNYNLPRHVCLSMSGYICLCLPLSVFVCLCMAMSVCLPPFVDVCLWLSVCLCLSVYVYDCLYACVFLSVYVCICLSVYIFLCLYVCILVCPCLYVSLSVSRPMCLSVLPHVLPSVLLFVTLSVLPSVHHPACVPRAMPFRRQLSCSSSLISEASHPLASGTDALRRRMERRSTDDKMQINEVDDASGRKERNRQRLRE